MFLTILLVYSLCFNKILFHPSNLKIIKGEDKNLDISFPFSIDYGKEGNIVKPIFNEGQKYFKKSYSINGTEIGETKFQLKFLGLIPVKNYNVNIVNRPELIPAGNSIGVSINTKGVLIVAITDVIDIEGNRISPAKDAGLKVGDSIVKINNEKIVTAEQVVSILNNVKEEKVRITVLRNKGEFDTVAVPVQSLQDNSYRLGIWVRDKTTGIGTLTYYNMNNNTFGALGHGITDVDTGELLEVENGLVMKARVSDIQQGKKGDPGEIKGVFYKTDQVIGDIKLNNEFGIYGNLKDEYVDKELEKPMKIAFKDEVEEGKAHILTTLDDNKIDKYEIEILKTTRQDKVSQKSMVIKIKDKRLLNKTGGIVQGMSGSPIIQNDKIVGAVTHVFVNDPTKGYGLYIEWMLNQEDKQ
ncbi:SpoIVB peptidase [Lachnospiraceae bacterium NSJ-29]|uniref:SpoIVB peptidase n=1 Tax=Wansuia hejianensis TaxID=2763667 RepID=A0A926INC9_9FIRM|nr:SpoIVB peptidase [Wansuia hejianensis]